MTYNLKSSYASVDELSTRDRGVSILYGRQPDALGGNIVPITVDAGGHLSIGTGLVLSASDIDIGDVVIKGVTDPTLQGTVYTPGEERIGLIRVGDITSPNANLFEVLTRDPRLNFVGSALEVTSGASGTIHPIQNITITAPTYTTFSSGSITPYSALGYVSKSYLVKNTGAIQAQVRAFVSLDGVTYDIPVLAASLLAPGASTWISETRAFTGIQFQVQRDPGGDTTMQFKGFAQ